MHQFTSAANSSAPPSSSRDASDPRVPLNESKIFGSILVTVLEIFKHQGQSESTVLAGSESVLTVDSQSSSDLLYRGRIDQNRETTFW